MKSMLKDAAILFAITIISGLILGLVYEVTKDPIARQQEQKKQEAYTQVFKDADHFTAEEAFDSEAAKKVIEDAYPSDDINEVVYAYDAEENLLGYVITVTSHEGYGGDIQFSMGIKLDGTLNGISLLTIAESAGLGMEAEPVLVPQFENKKVSAFEVTKTGSTNDNQIDSISGATITSRAITDGVNAGMKYFTDTFGIVEKTVDETVEGGDTSEGEE